MVSNIVLQIICTPVAIVTVTLYVVVIGIDAAASNVFGKVWRERVGHL
jgi:hypothetical protein